MYSFHFLFGMKPEEGPPPLSAWVYSLFLGLMMANSYFIIWSYEQIVTKYQSFPIWAMVNVLVGYLSWLFIYRGMMDGEKTAKLVREVRTTRTNKKKE